MEDARRFSDKLATRPRFDRQERLRHRFYEPLCMLWMLNPSTGHGFTDSIPSLERPHDDRQSGMWRSFLDALSWFGDHKHGGASVTAVAAERNHDAVHFWVCSRFQSSAGNISRVLSECALVSGSHDDELFSRTLERVIAMGIWFARDRVRSYQRELWYHLGKATAGVETQGAPGLQKAAADIEEVLRFLQSESPDQARICRMAYALASSSDLKLLSRNARAALQTSHWAKVRHCVARLGSWHRKAGIALRFARQFPHLFLDCSSSFLPLSNIQRLPLSDDKTNLRSILTRMLPAGSGDRVQELYEQIVGFRGLDFEHKFRELYSNQDTRLMAHAETFLLEHFYFQRLPYVWRDKYIGCSKPSCYCCHLYQRFHPDNPVLRPAHGTAWHRWAAPIIIDKDMDREKWRHHLAIVNKMNEHIRRDVLAEIRNRMPRRERVCDSTSKVTSDRSVS